VGVEDVQNIQRRPAVNVFANLRGKERVNVKVKVEVDIAQNLPEKSRYGINM
jgi:hypothetical protein